MKIYLYIDDEYADSPTLCGDPEEAVEAVKEHEGDCEGGHTAIELDTETGDIVDLAYCQDGEFTDKRSEFYENRNNSTG